jgi:predicted RNA-binding Zn ribbon-like protein
LLSVVNFAQDISNEPGVDGFQLKAAVQRLTVVVSRLETAQRLRHDLSANLDVTMEALNSIDLRQVNERLMTERSTLSTTNLNATNELLQEVIASPALWLDFRPPAPGPHLGG